MIYEPETSGFFPIPYFFLAKHRFCKYQLILQFVISSKKVIAVISKLQIIYWAFTTMIFVDLIAQYVEKNNKQLLYYEVGEKRSKFQNPAKFVHLKVILIE